MADGFLSRWSRRKLDVKEGRPVEEPAAPLAEPQVAPSAPSVAAPIESAPASSSGVQDTSGAMPGDAAAAATEPPPSLEDVARLTPEADFSRFVAKDVSPDVKNAALKKLFADPHYNVMDRMDIYIDDYSQPDPIPESMVRKLAAAQFLKLFGDEPKQEETESPATVVAHASADGETTENMAHFTVERETVAAQPIHADPDLRLQQDDAPPGEDPGEGDR